MDPRLERFVDRIPGWLQAGPTDDVVVASRVRLARNLAGRPFPHQMPVEEARDLCRRARERVAAFFERGMALEPAGLTGPDRELLVERSLASRDLLEAPRPTLALWTEDESLGLMVNEEDHFRIQSLVPGLNLEAAFEGARPLVAHLAEVFELAIHPRYGFLTACPTNAGTGLRASLLLHLPSLARARNPLQRALQTAQRSHLAVRGVHGEGSRALGHLYQISNQRTLGTDVSAQIRAVAEFGTLVSKYERDVRSALLGEEGNRRALKEDVAKAFQVLQESPALSTAQALDALSTLRLAALGGVVEEVLGRPFTPADLLRQSFQLQPGHLQARIGAALDPADRDSSRATLLRDALGIAHPENGHEKPPKGPEPS